MEFEKFKVMQFPRDVIVGHSILHNIPSLVPLYSRGKGVLIITGNITYGVTGREVESMLKDARIETQVIKTGDATYENLVKCEEEARGIKPGIMIGVGGGSKIDLTKKSAFDLDVPFISVPTSPSHDGIASPRATIKKGSLVLSENARMPVAIVADTSVLIKAPYRYLAAGAADVISNVTAVLDWKLANRIKGEEVSSSAATLAEYAATELMEKAHMILPGVEESAWLVTKQILASGTAMAIASSSRPASGSEHLFSHAIEMTGKGTAIHGELCALGTVATMFLHGGDWKKLASVFKQINISIRAADYGLTSEDVIHALSTAHSIRPERYTILGESDLSHSAAERALEITEII
ncbi:MAG: NAD(P)-dependent glycerol-1-phosphate dehydrogenase [Candidatus Thermoplasmatota archaeon]|jgi:glycerol-1-phosphate dehydrogenase [NAD(P)+]|nr:NAD(P)-dependent glycerol-1-phosphate dehydrogenase [Candidatus Thermoplasmatota archaeon]MCL5799910.1 NAD(P)-dependent glycerol-1-phosphate dehydrogenase [Candidatus Thermoplasmatota archaeon]